MIPIYQAAHSTDAHMVKNLLEQSGIASYIRGEYLQGGLGDIPVSGLISVCVGEHDAGRARAIVVDWDESTPVFEGRDDAVDESVVGVAPAQQPAAAQSSHTGRVITGFLAGAMLATGVAWWAWRTPTLGPEIDHNNDGVVDERAFFAGTTLTRVEIDRNRDGTMDAVQFYGRSGGIERGESDDDFDGRMERRDSYLQGEWIESEFDKDGDGIPDYKAYALSGVISREDWLDASGSTVKTIRYVGGWPAYSDIDATGDGHLDTRRHYDAHFEVERSEHLPSRH